MSDTPVIVVCVVTSAVVSMLISLGFHFFTVSQVTKWFDKFYIEWTKMLQDHTKSVSDVIKKLVTNDSVGQTDLTKLTPKSSELD